MKNASRMIGAAALCAVAVMNVAGAASDGGRKAAALTDVTSCAAVTISSPADGRPNGKMMEVKPFLVEYNDAADMARYSLDDGKTWIELRPGDTVSADARDADGQLAFRVSCAPAVPAQ